MAQIVEALLSIGVTVLLARAISPADFGTVAFALALTSIVSIALISPVGNAIVARRMTDHHQLTTAFVISVTTTTVVGILLAAITFAAKGPGSTAWAVTGIAASLPLTAIAVIDMAHAQANMRFRLLAVARIVAAAGAAAVALGLLAGGLGFAGLVSRAITTPVLQSIVCRIGAGWRFVRERGRATRDELIAYTRGLAGFSFVNQLARKGDDVIVGAVLGTKALGFYSVAYRFIEFPVGQAASASQMVLLPTLARLHEPERFRVALLRTQRVLVWAIAPIAVCSVALGDRAVTAFLGHQWTGTGPVIQIFGVVALIQAAGAQIGLIFMTREGTDLMLKWGLISAPTMLLGVIAGLPWGIEGVAIGYLIANVVLTYPGVRLAGGLVDLPPSRMFRSLAIPMSVAAVTAVGGLAVARALDIHSKGVIALAIVLLSLLYWLLALAVDRWMLRDVRELITIRAAPEVAA